MASVCNLSHTLPRGAFWVFGHGCEPTFRLAVWWSCTVQPCELLAHKSLHRGSSVIVSTLNLCMSLTELPAHVLSRVAAYALQPDDPCSVTMAEDSSNLREAVVLCRVHPVLRRATADCVRKIDFMRDVPAWPSVRIISPLAWPTLRELRVKIDRCRFCGFLKWLMGATGIQVLELNVEGKPYDREGLWSLEKKLLGRIFTHLGPSLRFLGINGIDSKALLLSALCHCSQLVSFRNTYSCACAASHQGPGSEAESRTLIASLCVNLCLLNKGSLKHVALPLRVSDFPTDGMALRSMVESTWATIWGNYCAGMKEAVANLPADESELAEMFERTKLRNDEIDQRMSGTLRSLRSSQAWSSIPAAPSEALRTLVPSLQDVTFEESYGFT